MEPYGRVDARCIAGRIVISDFIFNLNEVFSEYLDPIKLFMIVKVNNFRADLTSVSDKTKNTAHDEKEPHLWRTKSLVS